MWIHFFLVSSPHFPLKNRAVDIIGQRSVQSVVGGLHAENGTDKLKNTTVTAGKLSMQIRYTLNVTDYHNSFSTRY